MNANARDLVRRAGGKPIRLASKSLRCRGLQERVLAGEGFRGTLAYTLPEALWLAEHGARDIVVAYPTADEAALRELAERSAGGTLSAAGEAASAGGGPIAVMVDSAEQLALIERAARGIDAARVRICLDIDAGWRAFGGRVRVGVKRSPAHTPRQAAELAAAVVASGYAQLVGVMMYEAQIAGVGDTPPGRPLRARAIRAMQALSTRELAGRRAAVVEAVQGVLARSGEPALELVNGGGTGSLERTSSEPAVTEVTAGSGLYAPGLFDAYRAFTPTPGGAVRAVRRAPPRPGRRDGARRRLPGLGRRRRRAPAAPIPAGRAAPGPRGGGRRGADAAARVGRRRSGAGSARVPAPCKGRRAVRAFHDHARARR